MKKLLMIVLAVMICLSVIHLAAAEEIADSITLPAAGAAFPADKGVSPDNKKKTAAYDPETGFIWNLAQDAEVIFTVPEGVEGTFDVYLHVSKMIAQHTSQPFCFVIGDGEKFSVPVDCPVSADAAAKYTGDGDEENTGSLTDRGRFLIQRNAALKAGDQIRVILLHLLKQRDQEDRTLFLTE